MHIISGGSGDERPSPEQIRAMQLQYGPPDNEIPGSLDFTGLVQGTDIAVGLFGGEVYSSGMSLRLAVRIRRLTDPSVDLGSQIFQHGRPGWGPTGGSLLIGVGFADGRTATNVDAYSHADPFELSDEPRLSSSGGGGGRTWDLQFWLTPAPPPGDLTVIIAWPAQGVPETQLLVPAASLARAAANVVELWPWTPPEEDAEPASAPKPELPEGGWFAQHVASGEE
jgi:hypothetical protein